MELLAVVTLLGIMAAVVVSRHGRSFFSEFGARAVARELSLDLLTCQRSAISTGDDHYLEFTLSGGQVTSYRMMRTTGTGDVQVDAPKIISQDVTLTIVALGNQMRFQFEGQAGGAYQADVVGVERSYRIDVVPVTGAIRVTETTS